MCSSVWNGSTVVHTSRVLPFQTSSTSRLSSNRMKRYFSGSGLPCWISVDQVALLGVAQLVGFPSVWACHGQPSWYSRNALANPANDDGLCCSKLVLIDIDEAVTRAILSRAGRRRVGAPLAQSRHLLRQVEFLAALGLDDPDRAVRGA